MSTKHSAIEAAAVAVANCLTVGWSGIHRDKAHWKTTYGMLDGIYHEVNDLRQDDCREAARAALFAFRQWLADEGLVVVPRELDGKNPKHWGPVQEAVSEGEDWGVRFANKPEREVMAMYRKLVSMIAAAPDVLGKP